LSVDVSGDRQNSIKRKLSELLAKNAYTVSRNRTQYTVSAEVSFEEQAASNGIQIVRSGININLLNADGDVLFSYDKNIDKEGHRTLEGAYRISVVSLERDLENNFITEFNAFLGD
jgi:hypothetical protein